MLFRSDFTALGWSNVDKVWWTIAPALPNSQAYQSSERKVVVTNWAVTSNPASKRALKVAGPGSVRIEEDSTWVSTSGHWEAAPGNDPVNGAFAFWSQGRAIRAGRGDVRGRIGNGFAPRTLPKPPEEPTPCGIADPELTGTARPAMPSRAELPFFDRRPSDPRSTERFPERRFRPANRIAGAKGCCWQ